MKAAREKAEKWLFDNMPGYDPKYDEGGTLSLILLLKEQDRDTRHACAEAIVECPIEGNGRFWKGKVHNACMNVKAC